MDSANATAHLATAHLATAHLATLQAQIYDKITKSPEIQSELYSFIANDYPHSENENGIFVNISTLDPEKTRTLHKKILAIEECIVLRETQLHSCQVPPSETIPVPTETQVPPREPLMLTKTQIHLLKFDLNTGPYS